MISKGLIIGTCELYCGDCLDAMSEEELDSPEADSIRDESDSHWYAMSEEDKEFFRKIMEKIG